MVVWDRFCFWSISYDLVYIISVYAITFSVHAILEALLKHEFPRGQDKVNLPVLLFQLLHQWVVDFGVHWREDTFVRDGTIQYLLDGYVSQNVSDSSFRNRVKAETPFVT